MKAQWIKELEDRLAVKFSPNRELYTESPDIRVRALNGKERFPPSLRYAVETVPNPDDCRPAVVVYNNGGALHESIVLMRWHDFYKLFAHYFAARRELEMGG